MSKIWVAIAAVVLCLGLVLGIVGFGSSTPHADKMSDDHMSTDKMTGDHMGTDKMTGDHMGTDKMTGDHMGTDKKDTK
jgi:pentapeptide MXKDX repeat protein